MTENKKQSTSSVGYVGNVTVKVVGSKNKLKKQYKVKNKGYLPLFKYIAYSLLGNKESALCPIYAVAYHINHEENVEPLESDFFTANTVQISARPVVKGAGLNVSEHVAENSDDSDYVTAELTFTFPNSILVSDGNINCLALYCDDYYTTYSETTTKNPSAIVILRNSESINVNSGENIVLVWDLIVGNNNLVLE